MDLYFFSISIPFCFAYSSDIASSYLHQREELWSMKLSFDFLLFFIDKITNIVTPGLNYHSICNFHSDIATPPIRYVNKYVLCRRLAVEKLYKGAHYF